MRVGGRVMSRSKGQPVAIEEPTVDSWMANVRSWRKQTCRGHRKRTETTRATERLGALHRPAARMECRHARVPSSLAANPDSGSRSAITADELLWGGAP